MKKLFTYLSLAIALSACTDNAPLPQLNESQQTSTESNSSVRSINDAINIANTLAEAIDGSTNSRATHRRASTAKSVFTYGGHRSRANSDTLIYIVNYDNNNGYAIIAAPDAVNPILGFVEDGSFGDFESASNDGLQMFLSSAENYVSTQDLKPFDPDKPTPKPYYIEWTTEVNDTIAPRVTVKWGQSLPEGLYCPNKTAGCVQTALAQILSAFELPKSIALTYEGKDASSQSLDWGEIKKHVHSVAVKPENVSTENFNFQIHLSSCSASLSSHLALGRLCRQLGQLNKATYGETTTAPSMTAAKTTADLLLGKNLSIGNITDISTQNPYLLFRKMKNNNGIIYMEGTDSDKVTRHAWIFDGGLQVGSVITREYSTGIGIDGSGPTTFTTYNLTSLFHFNWGLNGSGNGYFLPDVYQPKNAEELDDLYDFSSNDNNYNTNVKFLVISTQ